MIARKHISILAAVAGLAALSGCSGEVVYDRGLGMARGAAGLSPASVDLGSYRIAYLERPGKTPTIFLLHGFASEKDAWLMFVRKLPRGHRVIALDLPGHGDSSFEPELPWHAQAIAERAGAAIDRLEPGAFHIAGNSLGGMVSTLVAAARPERARSVGLFDPAGVHPPTPSDFQLAVERGENPLIVRNETDFDTLLDYVFHDPPFMPWPVRRVLTERMIARASVNAHIFAALWTTSESLETVLPGLTIPALVLWGTEDRVLHPSSARVFGELLPDAQVIMLDGVGHSPMTERPRETARLYAGFIASRGPGNDADQVSGLTSRSSAARPASAGVLATTR